MDKETGEINQSKRKVSPDDILGYIGFGPFQVAAFLLSSSTYLVYGCDASVMIFIGKSLEKEWNITVTEYAILPAAASVPNVVGAIFFSILSDLYGRVWPYALCMGWIGACSVASAFSNNFYLLLGLRCLASFGIGGVFGFINPTIVEFLPVKNRAKVMVLNMVIGSSGLCLSCGLAWWLIPMYPEHGWRYYIIATGVPALIVFFYRVLFHFESPRYLISRGKITKAWKILKIIATFNGKELSKFASEQFCEITLPDQEHQVKSSSEPLVMQILKIFHPSRLRVTLSLTIIIMTQTIGFLSSQLFLPYFLTNVGVSTYFTIMVTSAAQIPGNLLLSIIVEWPGVGRLNSFRIFSVLSVIFFALLAFVQTSVTIPVFLILIYFSTAPILGLFYSYVSEFYPTNIRSVATAYFFVISAMMNIAGAFGVSRAVDIPQNWLFPAIFGGCYLVQFLTGLVMNYEPRGKQLKDKT